MKNKYLTTLILTLAITSALTGCANGPLAKKAVIQDKTIKEQIDEKRSNENQNTEIPSVKKRSQKRKQSQKILINSFHRMIYVHLYTECLQK